MKVSAWLVIEIAHEVNWMDRKRVKITKVLQKRPEKQMAVQVVLDIDPEALQPRVDAMVEYGMIVLTLPDPDESADLKDDDE